MHECACGSSDGTWLAWHAQRFEWGVEVGQPAMDFVLHTSTDSAMRQGVARQGARTATMLAGSRGQAALVLAL